MSFSTGSLRECENEGAWMIEVVGERGTRRAFTRVTKEGPLKVNSAPRRRWASAGSGKVSSMARE